MIPRIDSVFALWTVLFKRDRETTEFVGTILRSTEYIYRIRNRVAWHQKTPPVFLYEYIYIPGMYNVYVRVLYVPVAYFKVYTWYPGRYSYQRNWGGMLVHRVVVVRLFRAHRPLFRVCVVFWCWCHCVFFLLSLACVYRKGCGSIVCVVPGIKVRMNYLGECQVFSRVWWRIIMLNVARTGGGGTSLPRFWRGDFSFRLVSVYCTVGVVLQ